MSNIAQVNAARNASLVFFTLGAAGVPPEAPLPGPVLVRLLGDLGLSEAAARSTEAKKGLDALFTAENLQGLPSVFGALRSFTGALRMSTTTASFGRPPQIAAVMKVQLRR